MPRCCPFPCTSRRGRTRRYGRTSSGAARRPSGSMKPWPTTTARTSSSTRAASPAAYSRRASSAGKRGKARSRSRRTDTEARIASTTKRCTAATGSGTTCLFPGSNTCLSRGRATYASAKAALLQKSSGAAPPRAGAPTGVRSSRFSRTHDWLSDGALAADACGLFRGMRVGVA